MKLAPAALGSLREDWKTAGQGFGRANLIGIVGGVLAVVLLIASLGGIVGAVVTSDLPDLSAADFRDQMEAYEQVAAERGRTVEMRVAGYHSLPRPAIDLQISDRLPDSGPCLHPATLTVARLMNPRADEEDWNGIVEQLVQRPVTDFDGNNGMVSFLLAEPLKIGVPYVLRLEPPASCFTGALWNVAPVPFRLPNIRGSG